MNQVILASNNLGKVIEIQQALNNQYFQLIPQSEMNIPEIEETGLTFVENALIKARHAATLSGLPAIADDSGLVVHALNGEPGIYSARYAGNKKSPHANIEKLLSALNNNPQRQAYFYCVMVYLRYPNDPIPIICEAYWEGEILTAPQGEGGFGYDPLFYIPTHNCSAANLTLAEKNIISHRGKALAQLKKHLNKIYQ
ncbi:MAG: dITP/XTP pyrophosphatase [Legionellaceae bacterium]